MMKNWDLMTMMISRLPDDLEGIERMVAEALNVDHKPQPHGQIGGAAEVDYEASNRYGSSKSIVRRSTRRK